MGIKEYLRCCVVDENQMRSRWARALEDFSDGFSSVELSSEGLQGIWLLLTSATIL